MNFLNGTMAVSQCLSKIEPQYTMKMSIRMLTTLLMGYKTAGKLYSMERIEADSQAVEKLDELLFHKIPYVSDYI